MIDKKFYKIDVTGLKEWNLTLREFFNKLINISDAHLNIAISNGFADYEIKNMNIEETEGKFYFMIEAIKND